MSDDDIVARLRGFHPCCGLHCDGYGKDETVPDCIAAADEIARLRAENEKLREFKEMIMRPHPRRSRTGEER